MINVVKEHEPSRGGIGCTFLTSEQYEHSLAADLARLSHEKYNVWVCEMSLGLGSHDVCAIGAVTTLGKCTQIIRTAIIKAGKARAVRSWGMAWHGMAGT